LDSVGANLTSGMVTGGKLGSSSRAVVVIGSSVKGVSVVVLGRPLPLTLSRGKDVRSLSDPCPPDLEFVGKERNLCLPSALFCDASCVLSLLLSSRADSFLSSSRIRLTAASCWAESDVSWMKLVC